MIKVSKLNRYIPSFNIKYMIIVLVIIFIVLLGVVKRRNDGMMKLGHTVVYMKNYNKTVELPLDQRLQYELEESGVVYRYRYVVKSYHTTISISSGFCIPKHHI